MLHLLMSIFVFSGLFCSSGEQNNNNQQSIINITINNEIPKTHDFLGLGDDTLMPINTNNGNNYIDVDNNSNNKKSATKKADNIHPANFGYTNLVNGYVTDSSYMSMIPIARLQNHVTPQNNNAPSANNKKNQYTLEWYNKVNNNVNKNHAAIELLHKENNNLNNTVNKITSNLNKLIYYKQQEDNLKKSGEDVETKFNKFVDIMLNHEQKYLTQSETVSNIQEENLQLKDTVTGLQKTIENQNTVITEQNSVINNLVSNMKSLMERVTQIENKNKTEEGQNRFLDFVVENTNKRLDALEEKNNNDKITEGKRKEKPYNSKETPISNKTRKLFK